VRDTLARRRANDLLAVAGRRTVRGQLVRGRGRTSMRPLIRGEVVTVQTPRKKHSKPTVWEAVIRDSHPNPPIVVVRPVGGDLNRVVERQYIVQHDVPTIRRWARSGQDIDGDPRPDMAEELLGRAHASVKPRDRLSP